MLLSAPTLSCRGCSETASAHTVDASTNEGARALDLESFRTRARVPAIGWAVVTRSVESSGAVGTADLEGAAAASEMTAFEAASIAKTVISTCVMQLVEDGRLDLDEDVSTYVGFPIRHPRSSAPITLRHLLTHTAALADVPETSAPGNVALGDFLGRYFADAGSRGIFFDAGPGTGAGDSIVGPSIAALAVDRVAGSRCAVRASASIFVPLRMQTTAFGRDFIDAGTRLAAPYASKGDAFVRLPTPSHALYPVVDLFSSPHDLARFARAIVRGGELDGARILSSTSVDEMLHVQFPDAAPAEALGWQVRTFGEKRVFGHEGEDRGASTGLYLDRASGTGVVILANGDAFQGEGNETRTAALGELVERLFEGAPSAPRGR